MLVDNLTLIKQYRNKKGRFAKRRTPDLRYVWLVGGMILYAIVAVASDAIEQLHQPIVYAAEYDVEIVEPRTVLIEVEIDWDKNRVIEEIEKVFPDEPLMVDVARCESSFNPKAFNPTNTSNDQGIMQISEKYHQAHYQRLGLDMMDVQDNLEFARILYDEYGLQPWQASKKCWLK